MDRRTESKKSGIASVVQLTGRQRARISNDYQRPAAISDRPILTMVRSSTNQSSATGSSKSQAKDLDFCATRNAILFRRRRTFLSPRKLFVVSDCAMECGFTAKRGAGSRGPQLTRLLKINDEEPTKYQGLRPFEELTTINPNRRIKLETVPDRYTTRIMDLMTPLGMGQRGLIVAPPRTGKTTLLHHIADAVVKNHPEMKLIILLVDERPEEVTEIRRTVPTGRDDGEFERQRHQEPYPDCPARDRTGETFGRGRQGCVSSCSIPSPGPRAPSITRPAVAVGP